MHDNCWPSYPNRSAFSFIDSAYFPIFFGEIMLWRLAW